MYNSNYGHVSENYWCTTLTVHTYCKGIMYNSNYGHVSENYWCITLTVQYTVKVYVQL